MASKRDLGDGSVDEPADERASTIPVPQWFLDACAAAMEVRNLGQVAAGVLLGKVMGREAWTHTSVGRFLNGRRTGDVMAEAFRRAFNLPPPVFYPKDIEEALAMQQVAMAAEERRKALPPSVRGQIASRDMEAGVLERELEKRQPHAVKPDHAASGGRKGNRRGVGRGRS